MRLPPGSDPDKAIIGYMTALQGFSIEAITYGFQRFLRGECADVSPKYCPYPPELATIIRQGLLQRPSKQEPRGYVPADRELPGARERMRLKMPLYRYAFRNGLMDQLAKANADGLEAMLVLAMKWEIEVPEELLADPGALAESEEQWRRARNRAWTEIERNPPPFMVNRKRMLADNADRQVLHTDIDFDQFRKLSKARAIPTGASWVAALGIIYGPKPKVSA